MPQWKKHIVRFTSLVYHLVHALGECPLAMETRPRSSTKGDMLSMISRYAALSDVHARLLAAGNASIKVK